MIGLSLAAGVALASAGYQSLSPTAQWFGRAFHGLARGSKQIALTFDDGPNGRYTEDLLQVLAKHDVRATFFLIGRYVREQPGTVREIARQGHTIGNHTFAHSLLIFESGKRISQEILDCRQAIGEAIGEHSRLFRPPWGGRRPGAFRLVRQLGLEPVMWNVTGYDWNAPSAAFITKKVSDQIRGGDVVLLHDGSHQALGIDRSKTVVAVDQLIARFKRESHQFVSVAEMIESHPGTPPGDGVRLRD